MKFSESFSVDLSSQPADSVDPLEFRKLLTVNLQQLTQSASQM